jgi:hypothetical protein
MRRLFVLLFVLGISAAGFSQTSKTEIEPTDTIVKLGGKKLMVDVTKVTQSYISFKYPNEPKVYTIERKQVEKVIYKSGRIERFNKPILK